MGREIPTGESERLNTRWKLLSFELQMVFYRVGLLQYRLRTEKSTVSMREMRMSKLRRPNPYWWVHSQVQRLNVDELLLDVQKRNLLSFGKLILIFSSDHVAVCWRKNIKIVLLEMCAGIPQWYLYAVHQPKPPFLLSPKAETQWVERAFMWTGHKTPISWHASDTILSVLLKNT